MLTVTEKTRMFTGPAKTLPQVIYKGTPVAIFPDDVLASAVDAGDGWSKVVVDTGGGVGPEGYIPTDKIADRAAKGASIKQSEFAALCAGACSTFLVDLPYVLALARTETRTFWDDATGMIGAGVYAETGACGPFQFTRATWNGLVNKAGVLLGIREADIFQPGPQANLAVYSVQQAIIQHLESNFSAPPSPAQLYLYHFLGWPAAIKVLKGGESERIDALLMTVYSDAARVKQIMDGNASLLTTSGMARTLAGVLDEVAGRLQQSYEQNVPLLKDAPSWWPGASVPGAGGPSPWLDVARGELGQTELPGNPSNPRISEYLASVGLGAGASDDIAWCGGFVSWCLQNSGDPAAAATARGLVDGRWARAWRNLPKEVLVPVPGAIGITKPYSRDTTGHVGFVSRVDGGTVMLLGGNQRPAGGGDHITVSERPFPLVDFVGFRWP